MFGLSGFLKLEVAFSGYGTGMRFDCVFDNLCFLDRYELLASIGSVLSYMGDIGAWLNQSLFLYYFVLLLLVFGA